MPPSDSPSNSSTTVAELSSTAADLVLVYAPSAGPALGADPAPVVAPAVVPAQAEPVAGVGFHGWRWQVPVGEAAGRPDRPTHDSLHGRQRGRLHDRLHDRVPDGMAWAVVPARVAAAERRMLVLDVDSTLITQEVIELLAAHAGREAEVTAVTEAAMRGDVDFARSLYDRVQALAGLDAAVVDDVVAAVEPQPGAREVIAAFHGAGWEVCAVSGGFTEVLAPLAADLGLDRYRANDLEIVDGKLTGRVAGTVVDRAVKAEMLRQWSAEAGVPPEGVIAVGDGANDIDMLRTAGLAVAFCAKPALREHADVELDVPSLDVVRVLAGL